jgi:predicted DsbA family dithiol-disulfide isomerase
MSKPVLQINVVSDVVCPWCYIGKRRLENAMNLLSEKFEFQVEYFPFELNPQIPVGGVEQKSYLTQKFGGEERYQQITQHVTKVAEGEGLDFQFEKQKISPNTRNAHRLIQLAKEDDQHLPLVEAFFKAHFTDGIDLSSNDNLIDIAASVGLDRSKVQLFLESNTGTAEVEMAEQQLRQSGITGVPFYIIDNKYGISGAQSPESFVKAFEEIALTQVPVTSGESCDVDGENC